jgi:hypothetical protein
MSKKKVKISDVLKRALAELPSDFTVEQAQRYLIAKYIPQDIWEELGNLGKRRGLSYMPLATYRSLDEPEQMPEMAAHAVPQPVQPVFTCPQCRGEHVVERTWLELNPEPGRLCEIDVDAYDNTLSQYYCHDCEQIMDEILRNGQFYC